jgi:hypothetical protein
MGLFNTSTSRVYCILTPTSSRIHLQRCHAWYRCTRPLPAKAGTIPPDFASRSVIYKNPLGSFTCHKAGTWDILFYFLSEGRHNEDFPAARKIQWLRPGLNPRTRVPVVSMLTIRPPKPSKKTKACQSFDGYLIVTYGAFNGTTLWNPVVCTA